MNGAKERAQPLPALASGRHFTFSVFISNQQEIPSPEKKGEKIPVA